MNNVKDALLERLLLKQGMNSSQITAYLASESKNVAVEERKQILNDQSELIN